MGMKQKEKKMADYKKGDRPESSIFNNFSVIKTFDSFVIHF